MKKSTAFPSDFLTQEDVGDGLTIEIESVVMEEMPGDDKETKPVIICKDRPKPLPYKFAVNRINWDLIALATGEDDTDNWPGKRITLWQDKSVSFGGKLVGGIRVRPKTVEQAKPSDVKEEEIPF